MEASHAAVRCKEFDTTQQLNNKQMQEMRVQLLSQEDSLEKEMAATPVFLPGEFHGQRSLADYSPQGHKTVGHDSVTEQQIIEDYT